MNKQDIQLLYQYDRWANERVLKAVSALSTEQFTRDLGVSFHSVRDTLVHVLGGDWIWLEYWKNTPRNQEEFAALWERRAAIFKTDAYPDAATLRQKWTEVEQQQAAFVDQLTEESLARIFPVRTSEAKLAHLMQHVVNHSTYHRGQVAAMMRQLGAEPVSTDFFLFAQTPLDQH